MHAMRIPRGWARGDVPCRLEHVGRCGGAFQDSTLRGILVTDMPLVVSRWGQVCDDVRVHLPAVRSCALLAKPHQKRVNAVVAAAICLT